ncbi:hypothetical protein [Piscinibacter sp.]|uniref:hypothetical protein n=1 Tax=Piscinibacter sp. TaxID=1903157 RepID=UPI002C985C5F|nr:hypothetical protein [Albitalea sp.]HUG24224.1 hypothetical protein [Albitalea sp.]
MDTAHRASALAFGPAAADTPEFDIVLAAHKATRRFLFETLMQVGAMDVTDKDDVDGALNLLERLLEVLGERMDTRRWNQLARALGIAQITATAPVEAAALAA